jgi:hypothetical protein
MKRFVDMAGVLPEIPTPAMGGERAVDGLRAGVVHLLPAEALISQIGGGLLSIVPSTLPLSL